MQTILIGGGLLVAGIALGYFLRRTLIAGKANSLEGQLKLKLEEAETKAKEIIVEAKGKAVVALEEVKKEERERKVQLDKTEDRIRRKEESLEEETRRVGNKEQELHRETSKLDAVKAEAEAQRQKAIKELERVAGMTAEEARMRLRKEAEDLHRQDLSKTLQSMEHERREEVEKKASEIITTAIQRYARSHVTDITTTIFTLPNEDMKGKIIGREGRNIRTLERLTGVEIIVDETPESIILSSFDPLRREIAKATLEKLLKDGRIQPAKIEEKVAEATAELQKRMQTIGEQAALDLGIVDFPKEILQLLGRLNFRTSYGQNVLTHSVEMAHISAMLAAELHANVEIAKKGALVHDIGKAISHEVEGTHVELGRKILKKYGVDELVIRAMEAHHEEYPFSTPEAFIVAAADVLSAARPGARRDNVENYLKRLEDLEKIASQFEGVKQVYALSAGREVRIFVVPEKIDDFGALQLAKNVATKIQSELKYPGEVKVNVIRETRAEEYAR